LKEHFIKFRKNQISPKTAGDLQEKSSLQDSEQQEDSKPIIFDSKASLMSENEEPSGLEGSKPEDHKNHKIT